MAQKTFTIANGKLTVSGGGTTTQYIASDYRAKSWSNSDRDGMIIYPIAGSEEAWGHGTFTFKSYTEAALYISGVGYSPASVDDFVTVFNAVCGASLGFNTKYPETLFSQHIVLDTSVDEQVATAPVIAAGSAGYVTITAPSTNTGNIYVGGSDVNNTSYALEAGKSITLEISDLSLIWVQNESVGDSVDVIGVAKI